MIKLRRRGEPFEYVSIFDPAVDQGSPSFLAFEHAQHPRTKPPPLHPERRPARWKLRPLTCEQSRYVDACAPQDRAYERVAYGLLGVDGVTNEDGSPLVVRQEPGELGSRVPKEQLVTLYECAVNVFSELAVVIFKLSEIDPLSEPASASSPSPHLAPSAGIDSTTAAPA